MSTAVHYAALALLAWLLVNALIVAVYRRELLRLWREPVLRSPILIVESDDWGAGPLAQAVVLKDIAQVLAHHSDQTGRAPVMCLALVLAVPDGPAIAAARRYHRVSLDDPHFFPIMSALRGGEARGVFALQLHGMEHFWPPTLMASGDVAVSTWLRQPVPATTERLPSSLQSRWVDATHLPSTAHPESTLRAAIDEEVAAYSRVLGAPPQVVVPPTFVWTREVERAWEASGVQFVVTPGCRSTRRNAAGLPDGDEGPIANGDQAGGLTYLVRTDYFEPARGRDASHALRVLAKATCQGRPCILENHRDNFIFDAEQCRRSLAELDALYASALKQHPDLRFLATAELGRILRDRDSRWLSTGWGERLPCVWQRLRHSGRPWTLMRIAGLAAVGTAAVSFMGIRAAARKGVNTS